MVVLLRYPIGMEARRIARMQWCSRAGGDILSA